MKIGLLSVAACALALPLACEGAERPASSYADLILNHGKIITVDEGFHVVTAIAIRGDRILDVGSDEALAGLAGPRTQVVDLKGHAVIPGLIDDHHHFLSKAVDAYLGVDIALSPSIRDVVRRIKEKVDRTPAGQLVYTSSGWLPAQFVENRTPTKADLDPVSPDNPVIVQGGHSIYLNSYALRRLGINKDTASPAGGVIDKDPRTGEPTGRLTENAARLALSMPRGVATDEQKLDALRAGQKKMNAAGITSLREPAVSADNMRIFQELHDRGEMTVRVSMNYDLDPSQSTEELIKELDTWGVSTGFGDSMLRLDGVGEFGIDGGFEGALMTEHYAHAPGNEVPERYFGLQLIPTDKFEKVIIAMNRLNWRASIHVAGDRALDIVLDAYEKANREKPIARKRWSVEHLLYTRPDQFKRIRDLGLVVSTQFHAYMAAADMVYFWGPERAAKATRMRDWLDAGLKVGGGSDWSLLPANPFWMIYFWVTRDTRLSGVLGPDQRLTRPEALRVMTINNAYITMEENVKGSLEPGKLADLVVLSDDILTVPERRIRDITPIATMVGGKIVYSDERSNVTIH
jgi:predicted amidohydrolase YtcJ